MQYIKAGVILIVLMFTNLVLAVATQPALSTTFDTIEDVALGTGHYGVVHPFLENLNKVFWLVFILSAVGLVVWYIAQAHAKEYDQYQHYGRQ